MVIECMTFVPNGYSSLVFSFFFSNVYFSTFFCNLVLTIETCEGLIPACPSFMCYCTALVLANFVFGCMYLFDIPTTGHPYTHPPPPQSFKKKKKINCAASRLYPLHFHLLVLFIGYQLRMTGFFPWAVCPFIRNYTGNGINIFDWSVNYIPACPVCVLLYTKI